MLALTDFSYNLQTRRAIRRNLQAFPFEEQPQGDLRAAAVAITMVQSGEESALVLTRRSGQLRAHGGQWSLPGGRIDPGETAEQAALRELHEEINLELAPRSVLGRLDDYITRSGYRITPVVVWSGLAQKQLHPNPDEVASIHSAGFSELVQPDAPYFEKIPESDRPVLSMKLEADQIYAPTAALLYQFREAVLLGRATRVAHFDQPLFAWR